MPVSHQLLCFDVKHSVMKISFGLIVFTMLLHRCWFHPASDPLRNILLRQSTMCQANSLCSAMA